jgi:hypothetical protein
MNDAKGRFGSTPDGRDKVRLFRLGNLLCWLERPSSANSGRSQTPQIGQQRS